MLYFIGIEDLVANALIEIVEKTNKREVSFEKLQEYGAVIVRTLKATNKEALLMLSRESTNEFIHNCTECFSLRDEENGNSFIVLNDGVTTDALREHFMINLSLNVLLAFINNNSLRVLGVA